jgi:hypothetical protein
MIEEAREKGLHAKDIVERREVIDVPQVTADTSEKLLASSQAV